jgi:hypothetical protein
MGSRGSSVGIVTRLQAGQPRFDSRQGPTQPPIQWVPWPEVNRPGREADHSYPSSAKVKNACSYATTAPLSLHGVVFNQESSWGGT